MCHLQKKKELSQRLNSFIFTSRGDWIRTSDHTPPQTRTLTGLSYTPNCGCKGTALFGITKYFPQ